ncbi:glucose-6-phosphate isomerase [Thermodesulfobacteriota bacterium]
MAATTPTLDHGNMSPFVADHELELIQREVDAAHGTLVRGTGPGSDYLGWLHLPSRTRVKELKKIEEAAARVRESSDVLVVIGIGGSYLGARAVIEALTHHFGKGGGPEVLFAGHHLCGHYLKDLLDAVDGRRVSINVISKSGTTTEPGIAFRVLKGRLEQRLGREKARERIIATTDRSKGALRTMAEAEGYRTFGIPDDVGGRYSVLTPVGLLPIAAAGIDIRSLIDGAAGMEAASKETSIEGNAAYRYAALRSILYRKGYAIELLSNFRPALHSFGEWWKQLAGESEGKDGRGLFPAATDMTTDLHSLGQWIQQGRRSLFETFLMVSRPGRDVPVPQDRLNRDGLGYLAGKSLDYINKRAYRATAAAHRSGGVPNMTITIPRLDARSLGGLIYFFERAVGLTGTMLGINPFDQPGVEAYKTKMFELLGKPGFAGKKKKR